MGSRQTLPTRDDLIEKIKADIRGLNTLSIDSDEIGYHVDGQRSALREILAYLLGEDGNYRG